MGQKMEEILMGRDTTIFLLQYVGFILNMEISILNAVQEIEFLTLTVSSVKMTLSLPKEEIKWIQDQCQDLYVKGFVAVMELMKLIGLLASTIQAVLPVQLNFHYLQQQQMNALKLSGSYQEVLPLKKKSRKELQWWIQNLKLCNGRNNGWHSRNPRGSSEWKLLPQIFHQICQIQGTPEISISAVPSASKVLCLETGPIESGYQRNVTVLEKKIPLCIPTFLNDQ